MRLKKVLLAINSVDLSTGFYKLPQLLTAEFERIAPISLVQLSFDPMDGHAVTIHYKDNLNVTNYPALNKVINASLLMGVPDTLHVNNDMYEGMISVHGGLGIRFRFETITNDMFFAALADNHLFLECYIMAPDPTEFYHTSPFGQALTAVIPDPVTVIEQPVDVGVPVDGTVTDGELFFPYLFDQ